MTGLCTMHDTIRRSVLAEPWVRLQRGTGARANVSPNPEHHPRHADLLSFLSPSTLRLRWYLRAATLTRK